LSGLTETDAWCAFHRAFALAQNLRALRCGAYPSGTTEEMVRAQVSTRICDYTPHELRHGSMRVKRESMETCLRALATDSCELPLGICYATLEGVVPRGGPCHVEVNESHECAPGLHCDLSKSCPGECVDYVPVGSSAPGPCEWGVADRIDGVCTARLAEGADCTPGQAPDCGLFLECIPATRKCAPMRTVAIGAPCRGEEYVKCPIHATCGSSGVCEPRDDVGAPCDNGCVWGASCIYSTNRCALPRPEGGECSDFTGCDQSAFAMQCKRETQAATGTCVRYRARGEACSETFDCAAGLSCISTAGAQAICTDRRPDGGECLANHDCLETSYCEKTGAAARGACRRLKLAGEACNSVFECSTMSCDAETCACSTPRVYGFE
jgi:hypothetical protein